MKPNTIIALFLLITLTACSNNYPFDEGKLTETDSLVTLEFKPIEVQDGLFLTETGIINKETNELTVEYEFNWEFDSGDYEHIEYIPKELAKSVEDIRFSKEPDDIINPDPVVSWFVKLEDETDKKISYIISWERRPEEKITKSIEMFDYLRYYSRIRQCARADDKSDECFVKLLTTYKQFFTNQDCNGIGNEAEFTACRAFINDDPSYCAHDYCRKTHYYLESFNCKDDNCLAQAAIKTRYGEECTFLKDVSLRAKCMAGATQDDSYCDNLLEGKNNNNDNYDNCCRVISEESQRERCLAYNDKETKEENIDNDKEKQREDLSEYYCKVDAECPEKYFCNKDGFCETKVQEWDPIKYAENRK